MSASPESAKEFTYSNFIDELKILFVQAKAFDESERHCKSERFLDWKHQLEDITTKISRTHMDSSPNLHNRWFRDLSTVRNSSRDKEAFNRDLQDTLRELGRIINFYESHGDQQLLRVKKKGNTPAAQALINSDPQKPIEPEWPAKDKLTLYWVIKNIPLSAWSWFFGALAAAFAFGVSVGNFPSVQKKFEQWVETARSGDSPTKPASSP